MDKELDEIIFNYFPELRKTTVLYEDWKNLEAELGAYFEKKLKEVV